MDKDKKKPTLLIVGLLFTVIGLGMIGKLVLDVSGALAADNWPVVQGTVQSSSVNRVRLKDKPDEYEAKVQYTYEVARQVYSNDTIKFGYRPETESGAESLAAEFTAGKAVDVYYDPASPGKSVLQTGVSFNPLVPCLSPFILLIGLYAVRMGYRQMRGKA